MTETPADIAALRAALAEAEARAATAEAEAARVTAAARSAGDRGG